METFEHGDAVYLLTTEHGGPTGTGAQGTGSLYEQSC